MITAIDLKNCLGRGESEKKDYLSLPTLISWILHSM